MTNTFIDELLADVEAQEVGQRIELTRVQADLCLRKIRDLEGQLSEVERLAQEEQMLIEQYRQSENDRLTRKITWLAVQIEAFMREHNRLTGDKSLNLVSGQLKLRQQRDKVIVEDPEQAMPAAMKQGLVRVVPESFEIDAAKLLRHTKTTGEILPGTKLVEGDTKFTYITNKGGNNERHERQQAEAGTESGTERESEAVEIPAGR